VANWDYVFPYDERATEFLAREGLPHPTLARGNRAPTPRELIALGRPGVLFDVPDGAVIEAVRVRAESYEAELRVVYALAASCGQQWIYPDSGAPSIVVDPRIDFERALRVWTEANARDGGWEWLYRALYG
jgi:hypothetical protein